MEIEAGIEKSTQGIWYAFIFELYSGINNRINGIFKQRSAMIRADPYSQKAATQAILDRED